MNIAIVGYGKMGRMIERLATDRGIAVTLKLDEFNNANFEGITAANFKNVDVAIDFSVPSTVVGNIERIAALGVNLVVGTTGWQQHAAHVKSVVERHGIGLVWSPNYSVGVNAFFRIVEAAAKLLANEAEYEATGTEVHHSAKRRRAFGNADQAGGGRCAPRVTNGLVVRCLEPRGSDSRHARDRLRQRSRYNHFAAHRAQPRGFRAGRDQSGRVGGREEGFLRVRRCSLREVRHVYRMRNGHGYALPKRRIAR